VLKYSAAFPIEGKHILSISIGLQRGLLFLKLIRNRCSGRVIGLLSVIRLRTSLIISGSEKLLSLPVLYDPRDLFLKFVNIPNSKGGITKATQKFATQWQML
jgi:hypothetical protein